MKRSFLSIPLARNGLWNATHASGLRPYASAKYCALLLCRLSAEAKFHMGAPSTMRSAWWKRTASPWILFQTAVSRPGAISSERVTHQTASTRAVTGFRYPIMISADARIDICSRCIPSDPSSIARWVKRSHYPRHHPVTDAPVKASRRGSRATLVSIVAPRKRVWHSLLARKALRCKSDERRVVPLRSGTIFRWSCCL
jgi:hypothetical protein